MRHIDWLALPACLLLNLLSCEFTQRHVWLMKVRIQYNICACFTTSQPTVLLWWAQMYRVKANRHLSSYWEHFKVQQLLLFNMQRSYRIVKFVNAINVSVIVQLVGGVYPWCTIIRKKCFVFMCSHDSDCLSRVHSLLTYTWEIMINNFSIQTP